MNISFDEMMKICSVVTCHVSYLTMFVWVVRDMEVVVVKLNHLSSIRFDNTYNELGTSDMILKWLQQQTRNCTYRFGSHSLRMCLTTECNWAFWEWQTNYKHIEMIKSFLEIFDAWLLAKIFHWFCLGCLRHCKLVTKYAFGIHLNSPIDSVLRIKDSDASVIRRKKSPVNLYVYLQYNLIQVIEWRLLTGQWCYLYHVEW